MNDWFLCDTPDGADWVTCPKCNLNRTTISQDNNLRDEIMEDNISFIRDDKYCCDIVTDAEDKCDYNDLIYYCIKCKIIFKLGNIFVSRGCTDSTYFASMVKSFKFNNKEYFGIPVFKSHIHWKKLLRNKKITIEWKDNFVKKSDANYIKIEKNMAMKNDNTLF